jgi:hypothetical protein
VGTRGRSTRGRDGPIHNLLEDHNIHGSSIRPVPTPRGSEGRSPSFPRRSKPSVARPLLGSPHSKSHPSQSVSLFVPSVVRPLLGSQHSKSNLSQSVCSAKQRKGIAVTEYVFPIQSQ